MFPASRQLLAALASTAFLAASPPLHAQAAADPFTPVAWLAGCWQIEGGEAGTVEQWMAPAGGAMLGMSRTIQRGQLREFEFMQFQLDPTGKLSFVAQPQGRPPTAFALAAAGDRQARFSNPQHDFPQTVIYQAVGNDRLLARIEGPRNGQLRGIDFPMKRIACDGPR
ncbi:MAG TPA: DUF6265 family protein [Ideonella sp.]|uniref:DUF6265 family protein n=1 Tax=Ideonella sp. TaxID=1929293 RepID=UPI002C7D57E4|nr:DUF6265 family protein [Ideonella sp.]HSI51603.1 DUF6265 family protein [Ideonella sp.]